MCVCVLYLYYVIYYATFEMLVILLWKKYSIKTGFSTLYILITLAAAVFRGDISIQRIHVGLPYVRRPACPPKIASLIVYECMPQIKGDLHYRRRRRFSIVPLTAGDWRIADEQYGRVSYLLICICLPAISIRRRHRSRSLV